MTKLVFSTASEREGMLRYPWLQRYASVVLAQRKNWPHAWLVSGPEGVGKYALARWMSAVLLCEDRQSTGEPCGCCVSCVWYKEHRHPDSYVCVPEFALEEPFDFLTHAESDWIKLDQIRSLQDSLYRPPHRQQAKVVLIYPAELLNIAASNALLKLLEEPPALTTFLLVTHQAERLLPTLRSRCATLSVSAPAIHELGAWCSAQSLSPELLALSGGAPLKALSLKAIEPNYAPILEQLLYPERFDIDECKQWIEKYAKAERKAALLLIHELLYKVLHDWLNAFYGWAPRFFPAKKTYLNQQIVKISIPKLLKLVHDLDTVREHSKHPLNPVWILEELLLRYRELWS
jgi:DNA polymerase III subunit delta'